MNAAMAAQRVRAGVIGLLQCCRCLYPIHRYETSTMHDEACPAHGMVLSARAVSLESSPPAQVAGWMLACIDVDAPDEVWRAAEGLASTNPKGTRGTRGTR